MINELNLTVIIHVSCLKVEIVVGKVLDCEVIDANWLLQVTTTLNLLDQLLLDPVVIIEVASKRLSIFFG